MKKISIFIAIFFLGWLNSAMVNADPIIPQVHSTVVKPVSPR